MKLVIILFFFSSNAIPFDCPTTQSQWEELIRVEVRKLKDRSVPIEIKRTIYNKTKICINNSERKFQCFKNLEELLMDYHPDKYDNKKKNLEINSREYYDRNQEILTMDNAPDIFNGDTSKGNEFLSSIYNPSLTKQAIEKAIIENPDLTIVRNHSHMITSSTNVEKEHGLSQNNRLIVKQDLKNGCEAYYLTPIPRTEKNNTDDKDISISNSSFANINEKIKLSKLVMCKSDKPPRNQMYGAEFEVLERGKKPKIELTKDFGANSSRCMDCHRGYIPIRSSRDDEDLFGEDNKNRISELNKKYEEGRFGWYSKNKNGEYVELTENAQNFDLGNHDLENERDVKMRERVLNTGRFCVGAEGEGIPNQGETKKVFSRKEIDEFKGEFKKAMNCGSCHNDEYLPKIYLNRDNSANANYIQSYIVGHALDKKYWMPTDFGVKFARKQLFMCLLFESNMRNALDKTENYIGNFPNEWIEKNPCLSSSNENCGLDTIIANGNELEYFEDISENIKLNTKYVFKRDGYLVYQMRSNQEFLDDKNPSGIIYRPIIGNICTSGKCSKPNDILLKYDKSSGIIGLAMSRKIKAYVYDKNSIGNERLLSGDSLSILNEKIQQDLTHLSEQDFNQIEKSLKAGTLENAFKNQAIDGLSGGTKLVGNNLPKIELPEDLKGGMNTYIMMLMSAWDTKKMIKSIVNP